MKKITKAVFPVAGLGTRFLPATKASPKEMLPIVDKPLIQYAVEEALSAGVTELIFITGRNKRSIEDHFDKAYELETELENKNKQHLLEIVQGIIPRSATCVYIRQPEALGLGHAVLCAAPVVGQAPFAVILADDLIDGTPGALGQMVQIFNDRQCSVLGVTQVEPAETASYGMIAVENILPECMTVLNIVEKPAPGTAPSHWAVAGRYLLTPRIFDKLLYVQAGAAGEIQLTDAIATLLSEETILACPVSGARYDCGSKLGYLKAMVSFGLKHHEVGPLFAQYLKQISAQRREDE